MSDTDLTRAIETARSEETEDSVGGEIDDEIDRITREVLSEDSLGEEPVAARPAPEAGPVAEPAPTGEPVAGPPGPEPRRPEEAPERPEARPRIGEVAEERPGPGEEPSGEPPTEGVTAPKPAPDAATNYARQQGAQVP